MPRKKPNTVGGGARTNENGLAFEGRTDLLRALEAHPQLECKGTGEIFRDGKQVASYFVKHELYKNLLEPKGIDYRKVLSKKLLPDGALLVGNTLYVIEKKYQERAGSVDEKLQTCDFKKKQYERLLSPLGIKVEYYYVLSDWFKKPEYRDVFEYIESTGCRYFIEFLPLGDLGL